MRRGILVRQSREAHECIYIATGEITDTAQVFASEQKITLLNGAALMKVMQ